MPSWRSGSKALRGCRGCRTSPALPPQRGPYPGPAPRTWTRRSPCSLRVLSPGTRLRRAPEAGTAARQDFTPPSWDQAARYRQPCTSCLKTQGREGARDPRVSGMEGRTQSSAEGRAGAPAAARLAMVRPLPRRPDPATLAGAPAPPQPASPCRPPSAHCPAHSPSVPSPSGLSAPH